MSHIRSRPFINDDDVDSAEDIGDDLADEDYDGDIDAILDDITGGDEIIVPDADDAVDGPADEPIDLDADDSRADDPIAAAADGVNRIIEEYIVVPDADRVTSNRLTRAEQCDVISVRATQIARDSNAFVESAGLTTATDIAKREFMMRKCPLMVMREIGVPRVVTRSVMEGRRAVTYTVCEMVVEYWRVNEMEFSFSY